MTPTSQPISAFADVRGTQIHYLDWQAPGPAVLIVHGNTHAGGVYSPLARKLARDHRVVTVDLRGHGLSGKPASFAWSAMRDDIVGLIDQLQLDGVLLVAHSRGAGVAMLAAATRAVQVRGLVAFEPTIPLQILDPSLDAEARRVWSEQRIAQSANRRSTYPSREAAYMHYLGRGAFKAWQDEYLRAFIAHGLVDTPSGGCELASPLNVEADLVRARLGMDGWDEVGACPVPLLAVFGEHSGRIGGAVDPVAAIRSLFPDTRPAVMPGASHSGPMEQPALFEELVRTFEASIPEPSAR